MGNFLFNQELLTTCCALANLKSIYWFEIKLHSSDFNSQAEKKLVEKKKIDWAQTAQLFTCKEGEIHSVLEICQNSAQQTPAWVTDAVRL